VDGFVPGGQYQLSFFSSVYRNPPFTGPVAAAVAIGNGLLEFAYPGDANFASFGAESPWQMRTCEFVASQTRLRLKILASHKGGAGFIGFDDFSIRPLAVPDVVLLQNLGAEVPDMYCIPEKIRDPASESSLAEPSASVRLVINAVPKGQAMGVAKLGWHGPVGSRFEIEQSTNLNEWTAVSVEIRQATPGNFEAEIAMETDQVCFFRLRML
jgi:hypothetical protein